MERFEAPASCEGPLHEAEADPGSPVGRMAAQGPHHHRDRVLDCVNAHGHMRTTEDADVLLTPDGLRRFKERWLGRGWVEQFEGSKGLRDAREDVKINMLLTGEYPGDRKPKPIAFPDPTGAADPSSGDLPVLKLSVLIELDLASGMTAAHRMQDLDDVIQLIRRNALTTDYGKSLDPYVQEKYAELWKAAQVEEDY